MCEVLCRERARGGRRGDLRSDTFVRWTGRRQEIQYGTSPRKKEGAMVVSGAESLVCASRQKRWWMLGDLGTE